MRSFPSAVQSPPPIELPASPLLQEGPVSDTFTQFCVPYKKPSYLAVYIFVGIIMVQWLALGVSICYNCKNCNRRKREKRRRDQSATRAPLSDVRSTSGEELYRTQHSRGPQKKDPEREALRIAKENEGKEALNENLNIDKETGSASAFRGVNDNACDKIQVIVLDSHNTETFGGPSSSYSTRPFSEARRSKADDGTQASSSFSPMDEAQLTEPNAGRELYQLASSDYAKRLDKESRMTESHFREQHSQNISGKEHIERKTFVGVREEAQISKFSGDALPSYVSTKDQVQADPSSGASDHPSSSKAPTRTQLGSLRGQPGSSKASTSDCPVTTSILSGPGLFPSSSMGSFQYEKPDPHAKEFKLNPYAKSFTPTLRPSSIVSNVSPANAHTGTQLGNLRGQPRSSNSSSSDPTITTSIVSGPGLLPSSSMGPLPHEKSTLDPQSKKFKLNPNAKSFTPLRPSSHVSDVFHTATVPHIHGVPMGLEIGRSIGPQPAVYNPTATPMQSPQSFIHPNRPPLYGQQMILGHPMQVSYRPNYPPDTPFEGREY